MHVASWCIGYDQLISTICIVMHHGNVYKQIICKDYIFIQNNTYSSAVESSQERCAGNTVSCLLFRLIVLHRAQIFITFDFLHYHLFYKKN
jgi:hypothetical protein